MAVTLRRYRPGDDVVSLHERALREAGSNPADVPGNEDLHRVEAAYLDTGGEFLVAASGGEVVAMGGYKPRGEKTMELLRIAVDPDHQGEGLGTRLVTALEERAREAGYERVELETAARQTAAVAFYPARGYEETGRRQEGEYEIVTFEKSL